MKVETKPGFVQTRIDSKDTSSGKLYYHLQDDAIWIREGDYLFCISGRRAVLQVNKDPRQWRECPAGTSVTLTQE